MVDDSDEAHEISETDLEQWYRVHNGKDIDGRSAGIGIQARDRLIRKLIEQVRRLRAAPGQGVGSAEDPGSR
jgi:hypothetical protein